MKELRIETGLVSYKLNDAVEVTFNPADDAFVGRFFNAFDALGNIQDEYSRKDPANSFSDMFDAARERDGKMQEIIDGLFGVPVCAAVFGDMGLCALADGFTVWMNLMFAVMDEIMENLDEEGKKADPRIAKYAAKYQKYAARHVK